MYEKLIERLREYPDREETAGGYVEVDWQDLLDAADALESLTAQLAALQSENEELLTQHRTEHCEVAGYDCVELGRLRSANADKDKEIERLRLQHPVQVDGDVMALTLELAETKAILSRVEAERDAAIGCIDDIEDDLCRGACNDWAMAHIEEWRGAQGEG